MPSRRLALALAFLLPAAAEAETTVVRAGRLVDPEKGTVLTNQTIVVDGEKITAVGSNPPVPAGARVIDLSSLTVLPGLVDAHTHLGLTYKDVPEHDVYYLTYVMDSTALRAIQAASNGIQLLASGFTVVRDLGNNALYTDTAHRVAVDQGWIPGPTLVNSGLIIGGLGGQFWPTPEMAKHHDIVYPEYRDADTADEIVKAVRENMLFGAKVIKICVDCKPWGYSVDEMKLFVSEAAKGGLKVAGHVQTPEGATRAIEAGIWSIEHGFALTEEHHRKMAAKGIYLASTDTPEGVLAELRELRPHGGQAEERLEERRQGHVLDGHGLLADRRHAEPRRDDDRVPLHLEGRGHPEPGHPEGPDHHRVRVRPGGQGARRGRGRLAADFIAVRAIPSRTWTRSRTCAS